jgi:hypothetical protein
LKFSGQRGHSQQRELQEEYSKGLTAYRERRWDDAAAALNAALLALPGDGPSVALLKRVDSLKTNPPPPDWTGAWHIEK